MPAPLRPRDDDDPRDPRDPPDPPVPGEPEPQAHFPDVAIRFRDPRGGSGGCLPPEDAQRLASTIQGTLESVRGVPAFLRVEVLVGCIDSGEATEGSGATLIGIWTAGAPGTTETRQRGLERVRFGSPENVAFWISSTFLRRIVADAWDDTPKRYSNGRPDPHGPTRLNSYSLDFDDGFVTLEIRGYDERPWPDVWFWIQYRDRVQIGSGAVQCTTEVRQSNPPWYVKLWAVIDTLFSGLFTLIPGISVLTAGHFVGMVEVLGGSSHPPEMEGVACRVLGLLPREIMIPGTDKLVFTYQDRRVERRGIVVTGFALTARRAPEVRLILPRRVTVDYRSATAVLRFELTPDDLRAPFTVTWTGATSTGTSTNGTTGTLTVPVSFRQARQRVTRMIAVEVVDADGLLARDDAEVEIFAVDEEDADLPLICRRKPWLPECGGDGPRPDDR